MKILIADDDAQQRQLLMLTLEPYHCSVIEASTGDEAIQFARREKPDLIIMDHHMPGTNGYEAIQAIRQELDLSLVPFVMVTIISEIQSRQEDDRMTHCAFLSKPYSTEQLLATITRALGHPIQKK